MPDIHKNPNDSIDLSVATSYNEDVGTLYPVAHVYAPGGSAVSGSPFSLTHVGNGVYVKEAAFQAKVSSGTYQVIYIFYTNTGHTTEHSNYGRVHNTITISIQSTTGLGSGGGGMYYDDEPLRKLIKELKKQVTDLKKKVTSIEKQELSIDFAPVFSAIKDIKFPEIKMPKEFDDTNLKKSLDDISKKVTKKSNSLEGNIKKLTSHVAKSNDLLIKDTLQPVIVTVEKLKNSSIAELEKVRSDINSFIKGIDIKGDIAEYQKTIKQLMKDADETERIRLKFMLDSLTNLVILQRKLKQEIKINLNDKK